MARKNRDNFSQKTIRLLRDSVAHKCSNPDCRISTSAATIDNRINNIGDAAHICAAASGGPRYDPNMTSEERSSSENGIWLCKNCARRIDNDPDKYPVELLKNWKKQAIEAAKAELGQKLHNNNDMQNFLIQSLSGHSNNLITQAIPNVHEANERYFSSLDSRFNVVSKYDGHSCHFELQPTEDVQLLFEYVGKNKKDILKGYEKLTQQGKCLKLYTNELRVSGSHLIEKIMENDGELLISPPKIGAIIKLTFVNKETKIIDVVDDMHGIISLGSKTSNFNGSIYNGVLKFDFGFSSKFDSNSKISLKVDTRDWENVNVTKIPYFNKIYSFIDKIYSSEWDMLCSLEVNGEQLASGQLNLNNGNLSEKLKIIFLYTKRCRVIAEYLGLNIRFINGVGFSEKEHKNVYEISEILKGDISNKYKLPKIMYFTVLGNDYIRFLKDSHFIYDDVRFKISEKVKVFSDFFELEKIFIFNKVYLNTRKNKNKDGTTTIYIKPSEEFNFDIKYEVI